MEGELKDKILDFVKNNLTVTLLCFFGVVFLILGLVSYFGSASAGDGIEIEQAKVETGKISIDVEGAVLKPGLVEIKGDSRIQDALIAAGGLSAEANREWVAKNVNLAGKLVDGQKIFIPKEGDEAQTVQGPQNSGIININTASASDLESLPGIGKVTAEKIINNRPFQTTDELLTKKAVSSKVFEQIRDKVSAF